MASTNTPAGPNVPGFREQAITLAATVQSTVLEADKREKLTAEVTRFASELAEKTKEHATDAEKRSALLEYAKGFASQAVTTAKDPAARATLLDKLKITLNTVQEAVKDPAKRQELHDSLAATTHSLLQASGVTAPANTNAFEEGAGTPSPVPPKHAV